jgi:type I site-specific restriction endonuclease
MTGYERDQPEWLTRKKLIDPKLEGWGWSVVPFDSAKLAHRNGSYAIAEYPTANGPADYALLSNRKVLGIIEAKKLSLGPQGVLTQAQRYGRGLRESSFEFDGLRVPFLYSTNGEVIWFHDVRHALNRSRKVSAFRYEYERAVREGYLVDYDAVKIKSNVRMNGIFLQEGEEIGIIDTDIPTGAPRSRSPCTTSIILGS